MLKISDILKKRKTKTAAGKSDKEKKIKPSSAPAHKKKEIEQPSESRIDSAPQPQHKPIRPEPASSQAEFQKEPDDDREALDVYKEAVLLSKQMMQNFSENTEMILGNIKTVVDKLIAVLERGEFTLLRLLFSDYSKENGYLYEHSANVCVLTLYLGRFFKYNHRQLLIIGQAAFLHDIGLFNYNNLISQPKRLSQDEYNEVKKHPIAGKTILEKYVKNVTPGIVEAIVQEHERIDGKGYPFALKDKDICEAAKIIGLVDSYEALMHARPYRDKFECVDALKKIIAEKEKFEPKFLKALIDLLGLFPVSTIVKLNTKETGRVIRQTYQMPLRPVVSITHNAQGQVLDSSKCIDLAKNFSIFIHECVIEHNQKKEKNSG